MISEQFVFTLFPFDVEPLVRSITIIQDASRVQTPHASFWQQVPGQRQATAETGLLACCLSCAQSAVPQYSPHPLIRLSQSQEQLYMTSRLRKEGRKIWALYKYGTHSQLATLHALNTHGK